MNYTNNTNSTSVPVPLSPSVSGFPSNSTMVDLVSSLFVQDWVTTINYSSYVEQCSPYMCSYTYTQKANSIYTITLILGLYGGLTIILRWICLLIAPLFVKLYQYWKKRTNVVQTGATETNATATSFYPANDHDNTIDVQPRFPTPRHQYDYFLVI